MHNGDYHKAIKNVLHGSFSPIYLDGLEQVSLMKRYDTKTYFHVHRLKKILQDLSKEYYVLEVEGIRTCTYESLYYDTADYALYTQHHNGHLNRYKIRFRKYVESDITFFEIKFKSNKGRTIKERIPSNYIAQRMEGKFLQLVLDKTPLDADRLKPSIWVYFKRITLVCKDFSERATIDFDLSYQKGEQLEEIPNLAIAEIKQNRMQRNSIMMRILRQNGILPQKISKYCTGILTCCEGIKHNRFKRNLRQIHKVIANGNE